MSIKHKIKFKKNMDDRVAPDEMDTIRFEEHDEKDYKEKCKVYFNEDPVFVNEDEEYAKHLAKFFKGKSEVE